MKHIEDSGQAEGVSDQVAENIAALRRLFPELITEASTGSSIDVEVLKQLVGEKTVEQGEERFGLSWHGKRAARQLALTSSRGTLRPAPDDSVDWDGTQNLMIEGDNLEVLKLLQKSLAGKVKLIYIDPPYNTGKDFVYRDDFKDGVRHYLEVTGQAEGGARISSNTEAGGRFHTEWLNMMYPRLKLAREMLTEDGVIFVSIDDREVANMKLLCDAVFGEEHRLATFIWRKKSSVSYLAKNALVIHEYILAFSRSSGERLIDSQLVESSTDAVFHVVQAANDVKERIVRKGARLKGREEGATLTLEAGLYSLPSHAVELLDPMVFHDGILVSDSRVRGRFGVGQELLDEAAESIQVSVAGMMYRDKDGSDTKPPLSMIIEKDWSTRAASSQLKKLFDGQPLFDHPKPVALMQYLIHLCQDPTSIVLDFFAGSGTTGHAVMAQNAADGGSRRFVLVQLPEPLDAGVKEQKVAAEFCDGLGKPRNIAELTKERLRRAGEKVREENPMFAGDVGFRVFKLDSSNLTAWDPDRENLEDSLLAAVESVKSDRSESDVLYELLLRLGIDLCVPIQEREIAGKTVHAVGGGVLLACLAERVGREDVEGLAEGIVGWIGELEPAGDVTCVFRDAAFDDDVVKTNLTAVLEQHGVTTVRSV